MKEIEIESNSGTLSASVYESRDPTSVVVISSATGVKQEYYKKFSQFVSDKNITVITFDYTGIGRSLKKPIKQLKTTAEDWGKHDLEAVLSYTLTKYPNCKKTLIGHSIGGQLSGLAKSAMKLDKLVLVAAQSGYWKHWNGVGRFKMWFNWYILIPCVVKLFGYLNSKKLSGMENLPKNVANQWKNWSKQPDYLLSDESINETYFDKFHSDITAFSIEDDMFAPKPAVDWLTNLFTSASTNSIHLKPSDFKVKKIGHFGVFKSKFKDSIWNLVLEEIKN